MGLGRCGVRVEKSPTLLPPSCGGRTLAGNVRPASNLQHGGVVMMVGMFWGG